MKVQKLKDVVHEFKKYIGWMNVDFENINVKTWDIIIIANNFSLLDCELCIYYIFKPIDKEAPDLSKRLIIESNI